METRTEAAIYLEAQYAGNDAVNRKGGDDGYGCGSSFIIIKGTTAFYRWAKKNNLVKRDSYYGMILDTQDSIGGTLRQEDYNYAFAKVLENNGIQAFVQTYIN